MKIFNIKNSFFGSSSIPALSNLNLGSRNSHLFNSTASISFYNLFSSSPLNSFTHTLPLFYYSEDVKAIAIYQKFLLSNVWTDLKKTIPSLTERMQQSLELHRVDKYESPDIMLFVDIVLKQE